jgi:small subunit ribosomal protein S3
MGQKVHPKLFRLPLTRDWASRWFASEKDYAEFLLADEKIRRHLKKKLKAAAVSRIVIERAWTQEISNLAGGKQVKVDIVEIKRPDLDAQLVAENIAAQLERRISFRRAMKKAAQTTLDASALGIKIRCAGRLGGAEIARTEWLRLGTIPLHTLRIPIDYGFAEANTTAGKIGVKVWICKKEEKSEAEPAPRKQELAPTA